MPPEAPTEVPVPGPSINKETAGSIIRARESFPVTETSSFPSPVVRNQDLLCLKSVVPQDTPLPQLRDTERNRPLAIILRAPYQISRSGTPRKARTRRAAKDTVNNFTCQLSSALSPRLLETTDETEARPNSLDHDARRYLSAVPRDAKPGPAR